jgi:chemotaxis signal transduction protein
VAAADVREIVFLPALTRVPGQPPVLDGFLNLRGRAVPVITLGRLFDLDAAAFTLHTPLVILDGGEPVALAVDRVEEVAVISAWLPAPEGHSFNDCAVAAFDFGGRGATLLDARRILLEKERQFVAALEASAQAQIDSLGSPAA